MYSLYNENDCQVTPIKLDFFHFVFFIGCTFHKVTKSFSALSISHCCTLKRLCICDENCVCFICFVRPCFPLFSCLNSLRFFYKISILNWTWSCHFFDRLLYINRCSLKKWQYNKEIQCRVLLLVHCSTFILSKKWLEPFALLL